MPAKMTQELLSKRQLVSVDQYEAMFKSQLYDSHINVSSDAVKSAKLFQFLGWHNGERVYS